MIVSKIRKRIRQYPLLQKLSTTYKRHEQVQSTAGLLPVEIVEQILLMAQTWEGPRVALHEDLNLLSDLCDVTWGQGDYNKRLLSSASLVCKGWYAVAAGLLYRTVYIDSSSSLEEFLRTHKSRTWRRKDFAILKFTMHFDNHHDQKLFNKNKWSKLIENLVSTIGSHIEKSQTRFNLQMTHSNFYYFARSTSVDLSLITSLHLVVIKRFHRLSDHAPFWPAENAGICLPNLHTLIMNNYIIVEKRFSPVNFPALKRLHLSQCSFTAWTDESTSALTKDGTCSEWNLQYLFLHKVTGFHAFLISALRSSSKSLKSLAIAAHLYDAATVHPEIARLPSLQRLFVTDTFFEARSFLPETLEELCISRDRWSFTIPTLSIGEIVSYLLLMKRDQMPVPGLIYVECDDTHWTWSILEDLSTKCEGHGIRLQIYRQQ